MIEQGFYIEKEIPQPWWVMTYCGISTDADLDKAFGAILSAGAGREKAEKAAQVLKEPNSGYIFTDSSKCFSLIMISSATSYAELFNTITHEIDHLTAHVCERFGYDTDGEKSAYIQGEIGEGIYPLVVETVCPKCNCGKTHFRRQR